MGLPDVFMTLTGFIAYAGALAIAAAIPGPGVTALVARALGSGFRPAFAMSVGLILGDLTYLTAVVLGLAFPGADLWRHLHGREMAGRRLSRLAGLEVLVDGITPENITAKKGSTAWCPIFGRPGADHRQPEDDDLLRCHHADGDRSARHHAGRLWHPGRGHGARADGGAGALSAAGRQGAWPAEVAARAESI